MATFEKMSRWISLLYNTNERLKVQGGVNKNHTQIQSFLVNKGPHGESSAFQRF